jgi:F0F1-type ATP synthase assembly protein I
MPRHDPVPPRAGSPAPETKRLEEVQRAARAWSKYKKMMKWMLLAAGLTVVAALGWLKAMGEEMPIHMVIATIAGVGLSVLVGTGLMGLVFLSNSSGHDDAASGRNQDQ